MSAADYLRFIVALVFVLGLIGVFAILLRRYGPNAGLPITRGRTERRMAVVEVMALDARRRLVLVRRDDREHLLLLGMNDDLVVERDIPPRAAGDKPSGAFGAALTRADGRDTTIQDAT